MSVGPHVYTTVQRLVCTRCDYCKCNLIVSGRDPQYEYLCQHPGHPTTAEIGGAGEDAWIGSSDDTPPWCPVIVAKQKAIINVNLPEKSEGVQTPGRSRSGNGCESPVITSLRPSHFPAS